MPQSQTVKIIGTAQGRRMEKGEPGQALASPDTAKEKQGEPRAATLLVGPLPTALPHVLHHTETVDKGTRKQITNKYFINTVYKHFMAMESYIVVSCDWLLSLSQI